MNMEFNDFVEKAREALETKNGIKVEIRKTKKNNGVELTGLIFVGRYTNVHATVYLEPYYALLEDGMNIAEIIDYIQEVYETFRYDAFFDVSEILHYERVKENIMFRLIAYESNKEWLEELPHRRYLDLAITYYCMIGDSGNTTLNITNKIMKQWGIDEEELYGTAMRNTPRKLPIVTKSIEQNAFETIQRMIKRGTISNNYQLKELLINSLGDVFKDIELPENEEFDIENIDECIIDIINIFRNTNTSMTILSNKNYLQGAACILYPNVLRRMADIFGSDIFILPSSIHETILVPVKEDRDIGKEADILREMVTTINREELDKSDRLIDNVYLYQRESDSIIIP